MNDLCYQATNYTNIFFVSHRLAFIRGWIETFCGLIETIIEKYKKSLWFSKRNKDDNYLSAVASFRQIIASVVKNNYKSDSSVSNIKVFNQLKKRKLQQLGKHKRYLDKFDSSFKEVDTNLFNISEIQN